MKKYQAIKYYVAGHKEILEVSTSKEKLIHDYGFCTNVEIIEII